MFIFHVFLCFLVRFNLFEGNVAHRDGIASLVLLDMRKFHPLTSTSGEWYFETTVSYSGAITDAYQGLRVGLFATNSSLEAPQEVFHVNIYGLVHYRGQTIADIGPLESGDVIGCVFCMQPKGLSWISHNGHSSPVLRCPVLLEQRLEECLIGPGICVPAGITASMNCGEKAFSHSGTGDVCWKPFMEALGRPKMEIYDPILNWGFEFTLTPSLPFGNCIARDFEIVWQKPEGVDGSSNVVIWK